MSYTHAFSNGLLAMSYFGCLILLTASSWVVPLAYRTSSPNVGDLDSVAIWAVPDSALMFVTDKEENSVEIHDPTTNTWLSDFTGGGAPGGLDRPNGIAVVQNVSTPSGARDLLMVVERDNSRISVFDLPGMAYLGSIGQSVLDQPMGIGIHTYNDSLDIWITDEGASRVYVFHVLRDTTSVSGVLAFSFPINTTLESIVVDADNGRVIIADEGNFDLLVYNLQGVFQHRLGTGLFIDDPEGMAIVDRCAGSGYLIATDQNTIPTQFEIFDRITLDWLGCVVGVTTGTDGIWFTHASLPNFPGGSLYAHRSGTHVDAYDWNAIAAVTPLSTLRDCEGYTPTDVDPSFETTPDVLTVAGAVPARGPVQIRLQLDSPAVVDMFVFDVRGRRVRTLARADAVDAGAHTWSWDLTNERSHRVAPGVYWVRQTQPGAVRNLKVVVGR